jgi:putative transcriptional regulator
VSWWGNSVTCRCPPSPRCKPATATRGAASTGGDYGWTNATSSSASRPTPPRTGSWRRKQLADKLGINYQTIGYIERGDYNPSLELALSMAELFRLPVEAIFSFQPMTPLSEELFPEPPAQAR